MEIVCSSARRRTTWIETKNEAVLTAMLIMTVETDAVIEEIKVVDAITVVVVVVIEENVATTTAGAFLETAAPGVVMVRAIINTAGHPLRRSILVGSHRQRPLPL